MELALSICTSSIASNDAKNIGLIVARRNFAVAGDLNAKHQFVTTADSNLSGETFSEFFT